MSDGRCGLSTFSATPHISRLAITISQILTHPRTHGLAKCILSRPHTCYTVSMHGTCQLWLVPVVTVETPRNAGGCRAALSEIGSDLVGSEPELTPLICARHQKSSKIAQHLTTSHSPSIILIANSLPASFFDLHQVPVYLATPLPGHHGCFKDTAGQIHARLLLPA